MGSSCSSSQSVKDSVSVKSEDLAMDQTSPPEKTKEEVPAGVTKTERKGPDIRPKGPSLIESEYSSMCDDGMAATPPGVFHPAGARVGDPFPPTVDLPSLANLSTPIRRLLEGSMEEEGRGGEPRKEDGKARREKERGRSIALYVCAGEDAAAEVSCFSSRVVPSLRMHARSVGWELSAVLGPLADSGNCNRLVTAADVIAVTTSVLTGTNRPSHVIPLMFLHDTLGAPVLPPTLTVTQHETLSEALAADDTSPDLKGILDKWYISSDKGETGGDCGLYYQAPLPQNYSQYHSSNTTEREQCRVLCRQEGEALLAAMQRHLSPQEGATDGLKTPLEMETVAVLEQELGAAAVWVNTLQQGKPASEEGAPLLDRLADLQTRLQACVPLASIVQNVITWSADAAGAEPPHLAQLSDQLLSLLTSKINTIASKRKSVIDKCRLVPQSLLADLQEHHNFYRRIMASTKPRDHVQSAIKKYLEGAFHGVLLVSGPPGGGLTTAVAQAAQLARARQPGLLVVARSVGLTAECSSFAASVRAVAEHCSALYGGSAADCCKGFHQTRHLLRKSLSCATVACPLLVILDGFSRDSTDTPANTDWLPLPLPDNVKVILTCMSEVPTETKLREITTEDGAVTEIPPLTAEDLPAVLSGTGCRDACCRGLAVSLAESLGDQLTPTVTPLQIMVAVREWQLSRSTEAPQLRQTLELQLDAFFDQVESLFGEVLVQHALGLICSSVRGLSCSELQDLLSCDQDVMRQSFASATRPDQVHRFPSSVWHRFQHSVEPLLHSVVVSGTPLLCWWHPSVASHAAARYLPTQDVIRARCVTLVDCFQGKYSTGEPLLDKDTGVSTDRRCLPQPFTYRTGTEGGSSSDGGLMAQPSSSTYSPRCCPSKGCGAKCCAANRRRVDEEPRAVFRSCSQSFLGPAIEKYTLDHEWLIKKLAASNTEQIIGDIDAALLLCKDSLKPDLNCLKIALRLSTDSLDYDHRQFYAQLYGRLHDHVTRLPAFECCHLRKLLAACSKPPVHSLLPLTPCFVDPAQAESEDPVTSGEVLINQLSRLPTNPRHMVALSTDKGQLLVWDVTSKRPVRTLKGLHLPRKFEMIDDFFCLLLCGRELRIYNLDTGELVIKFREVMNQKMPFFGLNRPDHVVALSRSRMYVNMMNIANGECVATFKVGEDRFLNSLTVSENGRTCVCGDDTQKASALLVWDLSQRKLLYDLRIPHHEFLTRLAAITSEGHYVACVCRETEEQAANFLVVYDLESGTLFKRWKPGVSSLGLAISTPGVSVVAALEDATVTAYDLVTGNPRWAVKGHSYPADTIKVDPHGAFVVTYDSTGHDRAIRTWDMQTGACISVWTPDCPVTACEVSTDGRSVVVALAGRADLITLVLVHKTIPGVEEAKGDDTPYGHEENRGKEFDLA